LNSLSTQPVVEMDVFVGLARSASVVAVGLLAVACATVAPKTPEEQVKERAQARWERLVKGDAKGAYEYFSPGSRSVLSADSFAASIKPGFWKSVVVEKVTCESAQTCEAQATIEYEFQGRRTKTPLRETWIRDGSDWWYVQK
jgi:hypothetical protein